MYPRSNLSQPRKDLFQPKLMAMSVAACFTFGAPHAFANPSGATVVSGSASFAAAGNMLSVTNTPGAIINWQSFSIGVNEITRFLQQSSASAVLNRVVGAGGVVPQSIIDGILRSNGQVFLLNPSGVLIGSTGIIDAPGFVASSLNLSNQDFLNGRLRFTEVPGAGGISNAGIIRTPDGGRVFLVGPSVQNAGLIHAPNGDIILAAGKTVELVSENTPFVTVRITAGNEEAVNLGALISESGRIGMAGALVRQAGLISANSAVVGANGDVRLVATRDLSLEAGSRTTANGPSGGKVVLQAQAGTNLVAGAVEAKGASGKGGEVQALGVRVGVIGRGIIDASGDTGGGTVLAGGDYRGQNPAVQNAERTYIGPDGVIRADAGTSGDGGRVIVWADDAAAFYGTISARGGAQGGNGGLVETSGKHTLQALGRVDVGAPRGNGGTWLLDPEVADVVSGASGTGANDDLIAYGGVLYYSQGPSVSVISAGAVQDAMQAFGNVRIEAQGQALYGNTGNVNLKTDLTLSTPYGGGSITLLASNNVDFAADGTPHKITTSGQHVTVRANHDFANFSNGPSGVGVVKGGGAIDTSNNGSATGGDITLTGVGVTMGALKTNAGDIYITGYGGGVTTGDLTTRSLTPGSNGGPVQLSAYDGDIRVNGAIDTRGANGATGAYGGMAGGSVQLFRYGSTNPDANPRVRVTGSILTGGGDALANSGSSGGSGGSVASHNSNSYVYGAIDIQGGIDTHGGSGAAGSSSASSGGAGGEGGSLNFLAQAGIQVAGAINTRGGAGANAVSFTDPDVGLSGYGGADWYTQGGSGGGGGSVNLSSSGGPLSTASIDTRGGAGGSGATLTLGGSAGSNDYVYAYADGGAGGSGGWVQLTGASVTTGAISTGGGAGGAAGTVANQIAGADNFQSYNYADGGSGGSGGYVDLTSSYGSISVSGDIDTRGGHGAAGGSIQPGTGQNSFYVIADADGGQGGSGGYVDLNASTGSVSAQNVSSLGGNGAVGGQVQFSNTGDNLTAYLYAGGGDGGSGGRIAMSATGGSVTALALSSQGGQGADGGTLGNSGAVYGAGININIYAQGGDGGEGGYVDLYAGSGPSSSVTSQAIDASGGSGGKGGTVTLALTPGASSHVNANTHGGIGNDGGYVDLSADSGVTSGNINTSGGSGGSGGAITVSATDVGQSSSFSLNASGGSSYHGGGVYVNAGSGAAQTGAIAASGGNAGNGGSAQLTLALSEAQAPENLTVQMSADGGSSNQYYYYGGSTEIGIYAGASATTGNISARGGNGGAGGTLTFGTAAQPAMLAYGANIDMNADGGEGFMGGKVTVQAGTSVQTGSILAGGGAGGTGGSVGVNASGIGNTTSFELYARGGGSYYGGSISVSASGGSAQTGGIDSSAGNAGGGGSVQLSVNLGSTPASGVSVYAGAGGGSSMQDYYYGGSNPIGIYAATSATTGNLSSIGGAGGAGGSISISAPLGDSAYVSASADGGQGAGGSFIEASAATSVSTGAIAASAGKGGDGGSSVAFAGSAGASSTIGLSANGGYSNSTASGGGLTFTGYVGGNNGGGGIGISSATISTGSIAAKGGDGGRGGSVSSSATVGNGSILTLGASGGSGSTGGQVVMSPYDGGYSETGTISTGRIDVSSGKGGDGGSVTLSGALGMSSTATLNYYGGSVRYGSSSPYTAGDVDLAGGAVGTGTNDILALGGAGGDGGTGTASGDLGSGSNLWLNGQGGSASPGGYITLYAAYGNVSTGAIDIGGGNGGAGGAATVSGTLGSTSTATVDVSGGQAAIASYNIGSVDISTGSDNGSISTGALKAIGGTGGNAGTVTASGDLAYGAALSIAAHGGDGGEGGSLYLGTATTATVGGAIEVQGGGGGSGGSITLTGTVDPGASLSVAVSGGSGYNPYTGASGGSVRIFAGSITTGSIGASGGAGGNGAGGGAGWGSGGGDGGEGGYVELNAGAPNTLNANGAILADGGRGGDGANGNAFTGGGQGGGGGSGGDVNLSSPATNFTSIAASGGQGGAGGGGTASTPGGSGGWGGAGGRVDVSGAATVNAITAAAGLPGAAGADLGGGGGGAGGSNAGGNINVYNDDGNLNLAGALTTACADESCADSPGVVNLHATGSITQQSGAPVITGALSANADQGGVNLSSPGNRMNVLYVSAAYAGSCSSDFCDVYVVNGNVPQFDAGGTPTGGLLNVQNATAPSGNVTLISDLVAFTGPVGTSGTFTYDVAHPGLMVPDGEGGTRPLGIAFGEGFLGNVSADLIKIGSSALVGDIAITGFEAPAANTLSLATQGAIYAVNGGSITVPSLSLSGASVSLLGNNAVSALQGRASGSFFEFKNTLPVNLTLVDGSFAGGISAVSSVSLDNIGGGISGPNGITAGTFAYVNAGSGGSISDIAVNAGTYAQLVAAGGISGTTVNATTGFADVAAMGGGITDTDVEGGTYASVYASGAIANVSVRGNSNFAYLEGGGIDGASVMAATDADVYSSSAINNLSVTTTSGYIEVTANAGSITGSTLLAGTQASATASGGIADTSVRANSGAALVDAGGSASSVSVNAATDADVYAGAGITNSSVTASSGSAYVESGAGVSNTTVTAGTWLVVDALGGDVNGLTAHAGTDAEVYSSASILNSLVTATSGFASLDAGNSITGVTVSAATYAELSAGGSLGMPGAPLMVTTSGLYAQAYNGIHLNTFGAVVAHQLQNGESGDIVLNAYGGLTTTSLVENLGGDVIITTFSPLNINAGVYAAGNIQLASCAPLSAEGCGAPGGLIGLEENNSVFLDGPFTALGGGATPFLVGVGAGGTYTQGESFSANVPPVIVEETGTLANPIVVLLETPGGSQIEQGIVNETAPPDFVAEEQADNQRQEGDKKRRQQREAAVCK